MPRNLRFEVPPGGVVLRGQDHYWSVILSLHRRGEVWTTGEIADRCAAPVNRGDICDFVGRLVAGGFAAADESGEGRYRLLRTQLATPCLRRDGTPGEQGRVRTAMWNVLRGPLGRQGVTAQDLAFYASTESLTVKHLTARTYITHLSRAGLLRCIRPRKPGVPALWRARAGLGPLPPVILRGEIVFDQNTGQAVGPVEASEVQS
ncbi:hypothetical protein [Methylobacterium sp. SyP6R]|uniref:hypothetical protein n=1 Tax=Methylobacterium sp. SyP6R TaxID=2718876 RepID=UPI001F198EB4|nr:hypothetical protein [Methylobacterium sp. SyP6R]MCF4125010.1 hypothetical protein [Methylobacterium sp. SyP6R]